MQNIEETTSNVIDAVSGNPLPSSRLRFQLRVAEDSPSSSSTRQQQQIQFGEGRLTAMGVGCRRNGDEWMFSVGGRESISELFLRTPGLTRILISGEPGSGKSALGTVIAHCAAYCVRSHNGKIPVLASWSEVVRLGALSFEAYITSCYGVDSETTAFLLEEVCVLNLLFMKRGLQLGRNSLFLIMDNLDEADDSNEVIRSFIKSIENGTREICNTFFTLPPKASVL